jgi:hypothetical protein
MNNNAVLLVLGRSGVNACLAKLQTLSSATTLTCCKSLLPIIGKMFLALIYEVRLYSLLLKA